MTQKIAIIERMWYIDGIKGFGLDAANIKAERMGSTTLAGKRHVLSEYSHQKSKSTGFGSGFPLAKTRRGELPCLELSSTRNFQGWRNIGAGRF